MNQAARQNAMDFLTGIGIMGTEVEDLQFKKRKMTGSIDNDAFEYEGDFILKLNKKGMIKSVSADYEYNWGGYAELDWKKINQKKFEKSLTRGYFDEYQQGMAALLGGDIQGYIDELESIPGAGDISFTIRGNGQYINFD